MREVKFRAKRTDGCGWAYGHYVKTPITTEFNADGQFLDSGKGRHCIVQNSVAHEIDIETLGEFTGLKDKNGKDIFEGDIISHQRLAAAIELGMTEVPVVEGVLDSLG